MLIGCTTAKGLHPYNMKHYWYLLTFIATFIGMYTTVYANSGESSAVSTLRTQAIPNQTAVGGKPFVFTLPADAFGGATYDTYTATLHNGSNDPLPDWLSFNGHPDTLTFTGQPTNDHIGSYAIQVTGQSGGISASESFDITVQAAPTLDLNAAVERQDRDTIFHEGDPPVKVIGSYLDISDLDGTLLSAATVTLIAPISGEEELVISPADILAAESIGIKVETNVSTGAIKLTGVDSKPEATFDEYKSVLRRIFYANDAEKPTEGTRVIVIQVWDSEGNVSNGVPSLIDVIPVNDPPTLDIDINDDHNDGTADYSNTFVEDGEAVVVTDRDVEITDIDHEEIAQIVVSITNRKDGAQEILTIEGSLPSGFSYGYDIVRGEDLIINGNGSLADYEAALRQIVYRNDSQDPDDTPREISIMYNDLKPNGLAFRTAIIYVVPKNDPPYTRADTVVVAEYSINNAFRLPDPADVDNELSELEIIINALPNLGTVTQPDGTPVAVGDRLPAAQFAHLQYDTPSNYDGVTPPGNLVYTVEDDSAATAISTVTFLINNAPEADDFYATTDEDVSYPFLLSDFAAGYFDMEGDTLAYIVIASLPAHGLLLLDNDTVQLADAIRVTALDSGKLVFVPALNQNGHPYTSFLFRVKDERGATSEPYVASIIVNPVSDPPAVDTVHVSGKENETIFFTADDFVAQFSDPENDTLTMVKIESLPHNGTLLLNNEPVAVKDEIAVGDLDQLTFMPDPGFDGTTQFRWNGHDGSAYAERAAPVIITLAEDNRIAAVNDTIRLVDVALYHGSLVPQVTNPTGGPFAFATLPVVNTEHGTLTIRADGSYTYQTTEGFAGEDAFTFEVCNTNTSPQCAQATVTIIVEEPLFVYEGFSPDGDGKNDVWRIRSIENYPDNTVRIFNRWGNLVFEIKGYDNQERAWSSYSTRGLVSGDVPDGTYFYLIDLGNGKKPYSGYVIVNR